MKNDWDSIANIWQEEDARRAALRAVALDENAKPKGRAAAIRRLGAGDPVMRQLLYSPVNEIQIVLACVMAADAHARAGYPPGGGAT